MHRIFELVGTEKLEWCRCHLSGEAGWGIEELVIQ